MLMRLNLRLYKRRWNLCVKYTSAPRLIAPRLIATRRSATYRIATQRQHQKDKEMKIEETESMTGAAISKVFAVTAQSITNWHNNDGCPRNSDNAKTYNLCEVIAWKVLRGTLKTVASTGYNAERERLTKAQADTAELNLSLALGDVLPIKEVRKELQNCLVACRVRIMNLRRAIAPVAAGMTDPEEIGDMIDVRCIEALNELAKPPGGVVEEGNELDRPAPKAVGKRVGRPRKAP